LNGTGAAAEERQSQRPRKRRYRARTSRFSWRGAHQRNTFIFGTLLGVSEARKLCIVLNLLNPSSLWL
jgi:hypothetical protein